MDWGLGHATRCIPIIHYLLQKGHEITIAGNKATNALLIKEFPTAEFLLIKGYNIKYPTQSQLFVWKIMLQLPKIWCAIKQENRWLLKQLKTRSWDLVISDNRYGKIGRAHV